MTKDFKNITAQQLSQVLYKVDPCNFAYHEDDYLKIAKFSLHTAVKDRGLIDSINLSLAFFLSRDHILSDESSRKILNKVKKLIKNNV